MRISTKGRYAVTAMMDLAIHEKNGPVTLADISNGQDISLSYLEQIFSKLRHYGLIEGMRGPRGGYRLARPSDQITVADIIKAVDEKIDTTSCGGAGNCLEGQRCLTHELWTALSQQIHDFLNGITLAQFTTLPTVQESSRLRDMTTPRRLRRDERIPGPDST